MVICPTVTHYSDKPGLLIPFFLWCDTPHTDVRLTPDQLLDIPKTSPLASPQGENDCFVANKIVTHFVGNYLPYDPFWKKALFFFVTSLKTIMERHQQPLWMVPVFVACGGM